MRARTVSAVTSTIDALFERALAAQDAAGEDCEAEDLSTLVELHEMATEAVFARALALVDAPDWPSRRLGLRVLQEIGEGRRPRPFNQRAIDALLPRVGSCESLVELRALVCTLGWQFDARVVPTLLALVDHPDSVVRYHVASNLPGCACRSDDTIDERALPALLQLTTDPDSDVRYYATAAFAVDDPAVDSPAIRSALQDRLSDADESIRLCARRALDLRRTAES
jgi:HEAT repeat protein